MTYDELLIEADKLGIMVREANLRTRDGRCSGNRIAIHKNLSNCEKACVLAEELGHYYLTVGDITNQKIINNRKQELKARRHAYNFLIEPEDIVNAMKKGCNNRYEIAEYLNISEAFFNELIDDYRKQYGLGIYVENYYLQLEPNLGLIKDLGGLFDYKK
ncbi:ImmA/IrrE family metallo-endopeptidase [Clostridium paraputrificum]|uniref:ImmA/IrrE family metallo-endopeptidase n=1 Tax=Clostridium paraputrificum TaxID=29363 RepID=UPI003D324CEE